MSLPEWILKVKACSDQDCLCAGRIEDIKQAFGIAWQLIEDYRRHVLYKGPHTHDLVDTGKVVAAMQSIKEYGE